MHISHGWDLNGSDFYHMATVDLCETLPVNWVSRVCSVVSLTRCCALWVSSSVDMWPRVFGLLHGWHVCVFLWLPTGPGNRNCAACVWWQRRRLWWARHSRGWRFDRTLTSLTCTFHLVISMIARWVIPRKIPSSKLSAILWKLIRVHDKFF